MFDLPIYSGQIRLADTASFLRRMTVSYGWLMRWILRCGERVMINNVKYAGQKGTVESNVHQRTVDYPDAWSSGYHLMLDTGELVTVRWEQVEGLV